MTMTDLPTRACRQCGEQVAWVRTSTGATMPLDPKPDPAGIVFVAVEHGKIVARVGKRGDVLTGVRYTAHFATCSVLNKHRTTAPKRATAPAPPEFEQGTLI